MSMRGRFGRAGLALGSAMLVLPVLGGIAAAQDFDISIYFVGCAAPTGFHGYLARDAEEAGRNLGVSVTYIYPDQLTIPNQIQKIEEAIAAQADGIAVCVFTEDAAYTEVAARAKKAGIAFGCAAAPPAGSQVRDPNDIFLFRTGSDERAAGRLTAQRLIEMGVKGRVVGNQQPGDATCMDRATESLAVARAMFFGSSLLVLDEPTSALAVRQAGRVLDHIAQARDQCQAVILITHNFRHALSVADDLTILAQGRVAAHFRRDEIDVDELTDLVARVA
jgi:ABC-type sugar transport system substrate-binding protein